MARRVITRAFMGGAAVAVAGLIVVATTPAGAAPNCVEFFGGALANHGQHVVGDYIMGTGHDGEWPPAGQVGAVVGHRGPLLKGQSGILLHGTSPGASFCNDSNSPTYPPGLD